MCNCGNKRSLWAAAATDVQFEYIGNAPLSVRGYITQKVYRFQPGEIQMIDRRDVPGMENISLLKKVSPS
jgi:hypothetical protein